MTRDGVLAIRLLDRPALARPGNARRNLLVGDIRARHRQLEGETHIQQNGTTDGAPGDGRRNRPRFQPLENPLLCAYSSGAARSWPTGAPSFKRTIFAFVTPEGMRTFESSSRRGGAGSDHVGAVDEDDRRRRRRERSAIRPWRAACRSGSARRRPSTCPVRSDRRAAACPRTARASRTSRRCTYDAADPPVSGGWVRTPAGMSSFTSTTRVPFFVLPFDDVDDNRLAGDDASGRPCSSRCKEPALRCRTCLSPIGERSARAAIATVADRYSGDRLADNSLFGPESIVRRSALRVSRSGSPRRPS